MPKVDQWQRGRPGSCGAARNPGAAQNYLSHAQTKYSFLLGVGTDGKMLRDREITVSQAFIIGPLTAASSVSIRVTINH